MNIAEKRIISVKKNVGSYIFLPTKKINQNS